MPVAVVPAHSLGRKGLLEAEKCYPALMAHRLTLISGKMRLMDIPSGSLRQEVEALDRFVDAHLRRNFAALGTDFGMWGLGQTFASASTILPALAEHLGASNLFIGAIPSLLTVGVALPQLFFANYTERLPRNLRFILTYTVWERLPLLMLAGVAFFVAERWPGLMLLAILLYLTTISVAGGALLPAWMNLIGKVIPTHYRGRLFAYGNTLAAGLGLGGAALTGFYLETYAFPLNYTLCFATGFIFLVFSFISLALVAEPAVVSSKPKVPLAVYLHQLPKVLARDRNFAWFLAGRAMAVLGATANGFYTVFALRTLAVPEWQAARFTLVLLAGQAIASVLFGYAADRAGHKPILVTGVVGLVVGNVLALLSTTVEGVYLVFLCVAVFIAAVNVSGLNLSMEFAPVADRPTYIGLATTLLAPLFFVSTLVGGIMADYAGYRVVFVFAALAAATSASILVLRVRDPRFLPRSTAQEM